MGNTTVKSEISTKTIKTFSPIEYAGQWYEIARYAFNGTPTLVYERGCDKAIAIYRWDPSNDIMSIENVCTDADLNPIRKSFGKATVPNPTDSGKLLVEFEDSLPVDIGKQPYWIHYTDYKNYSLVGGPSGNYLWLLARNPSVPKEEVAKFINMVRELGYDPDRLILNPNSIY